MTRVTNWNTLFLSLSAVHRHSFQTKADGRKSVRERHELLEWIGDVIIEELVCRVMIAQMPFFKLPYQVVRRLRTTLVTNAQLAKVFQRFGYSHRFRGLSLKQQADFIESMVGELACARRQVAKSLAPFRDAVLDRIVTELLEMDPSLRVSRPPEAPGEVNSFDLLEALEGEAFMHDDQQPDFDCSIAELLQEKDTEDADSESKRHEESPDTVDSRVDAKSISTNASEASTLMQDTNASDESDDEADIDGPFHLFDFVPARTPSNSVGKDAFLVNLVCKTQNLWQKIGASEKHPLKKSRNNFNLLKIFGMTVLSERISQHIFHRVAKTRESNPQPSDLTYQRQSALCRSHLASCVDKLIMSNAKDQLHGTALSTLQVNTLRAVIGYMAATSQWRLLHEICAYIVFESPEIGKASTSSCCCSPCIWSGKLSLHSNECPLHFGNFYQAEWETRPNIPLCKMPTSIRTIRQQARLNFKPTESMEFPSRWCNLKQATEAQLQEKAQKKRKRESTKVVSKLPRQKQVKSSSRRPHVVLERYKQSNFLRILESIVVAFASGRIEAAQTFLTTSQEDLTCCINAFEECRIDPKRLTLAMNSSFHRLLLHGLCEFHQLHSQSRTTTSKIRVTELLRPDCNQWQPIRRFTTAPSSP